jgi:hypothetical protein
MEPPRDRPCSNPWIQVLAGIILLTCIIAAAIVVGGMPQTSGTPAACNCPAGPSLVPVFTDPAEKLKELKDPAFSKKLYAEAVTYEPMLGTPGTQVHMNFWSGKGNHGNVLKLLDTVNQGEAATAHPPNRAIWNEGVNAFYQYPSWVTILNEHWYDRGSGANGTVTIFGKIYQDPCPITYDQADGIVGEYSARYAGMAEYIAEATGKPVKVWCFIYGAKPNRVFSRYEEPVLKNLEEKGLVEVYYAKSPDAAWENPDDWIRGTAHSPLPA